MLVDIDRESQAEFRTGSGTVGLSVVRLGAASARQTVTLTDVTAGTFKLGVGESETDAISFDAAAAAVQMGVHPQEAIETFSDHYKKFQSRQEDSK